MKKWSLRIAVVVALVAAAFLLRARHRLPDTPEAAVSAFFDAAARGDDGAYLRLASGELRNSLENTKAQLGTPEFQESLRRSAAGIKGLAVTRAGGAPADFVAVDVEIVFADRIERQRMLLAPQGSGWTIASIEAAEMVKPPIPYGTPVFEEPAAEETVAEPPRE